MKAPAFLSRWFNRNGAEAHVAISAESESTFSGRQVEQHTHAPRIRLEPVEEPNCMGAATCRHCGAELEVVCPNGHGGADDVPRVSWKGRGRKPTRCEKHLTKHPEQKRSA
jgi:hypothetical protein